MQEGLTSRLTKLLLIPLFLGLCGHLSASESSGLDSEASVKYLDEIKTLYLTTDERQALLSHSNALLDTYGLKAAYQVGQASPEDLMYQLSLGVPGELRIREERRSETGNMAVRNRSYSMFGVDPYVSYRCPAQGVMCVFDAPGGAEPWIIILRDPKGAEELAKALSFLIRYIQKG